MMDTYIYSPSGAELIAFCNGFRNVIGPIQGRAAIEAQTTSEGLVATAQAACGDPSLWYACIRDGEVDPTGDISVCDEATGKAVCGVWA